MNRRPAGPDGFHVDGGGPSVDYARVKFVLLAAGLGSRLGPLTAQLPKALISVGGMPLVAHALRFAARLEPTQVIVVGGFGHALVAAELDRLAGSRHPAAHLPITLVENTRFRDGNLISLMTARPYLDDEFVLLNVDHIYRAGIASVVRPDADEVTAFIDTDRQLGADDMKVERDGAGRVRRISKTLDKFDCGYVGMTRVPRAAIDRYFATADRALADDGPAIHVERVLARLAETANPPVCRDISGHGWLEVDTPDERAHAEEALRDPTWD
jgi:choline kinase